MKFFFLKKYYSRNFKLLILISVFFFLYQVLLQPRLLCAGINNCEALVMPLATIFYTLMIIFAIVGSFIVYTIVRRIGLKFYPNWNWFILIGAIMLIYIFFSISKSYIILREDSITVSSHPLLLNSIFLHAPYGVYAVNKNEIANIEQRFSYAVHYKGSYGCQRDNYIVLKSNERIFLDFGLSNTLGNKISKKYSIPIVTVHDGSSECLRLIQDRMKLGL